MYEQGGALYFDWVDPDANHPGQYRLYEVAPDLFFTETGEAMDFRSTPPTFGNVKLKKVGSGPSAFAWIVLALSGLEMLSILIALSLGFVWRWIWQRGREPRSGGPGIATTIGSNVLMIVTSLCGLVSIGMLAIIPRLIYSGFLGWLALPIGQKLLFHAPLGLAVCTFMLMVLAVLAWRKGWWGRGQRWHYTALVVAALAETALLAGWRLIGLG
jgi:hypothetical protein